MSERSLQFQLVEPLHLLHPRLLGHDPGTAKRVEVTPTVVGMEARRGIAAIGELAEILAVIIVQATEYPALGVVAGVVGRVGEHGGGTVELLVAEVRIHVLAVAADIVVVGLVALVSGKQ